VSRFGRRVGVGLLWTVAISRMVTTTTAIVAERPLVPPPEPAEPDDPLVVPDDPLAAPAPEAAPDSWRTELRSTTWILVGATLDFPAITLTVLARVTHRRGLRRASARRRLLTYTGPQAVLDRLVSGCVCNPGRIERPD
jgi:hypothetical protein